MKEITFIVLMIAVLVGLIYLTTSKITPIPAGTKLVYRSVEPTGLYGTAEYYFFDDQGNRYCVSQTTFDKRPDLPRK